MIGDELGPSSRALLDAARGSLGPDADAIRRMRTKIAATVAGGAATVAATSHASAATATTTPPAATASVGSGIALKLSIVGVIALASLGVLALRDRTPVLDRPQLTPSTRVDQRDHAATAPDELAPPRASSTTRPASRASSRSPSTRAPSTSAPMAAPPATSTATPTATATLAREVDLLDAAMAALRDGDPRGALAAVRTHARETAGHGQLTEDAAAIEIEALCALSDPLAPVRLDEFDARFPTSVQRARLSTACK